MKKEKSKVTGKNENNTTFKPVIQNLKHKQAQPIMNKKQNSQEPTKPSKVFTSQQPSNTTSKTPKQNMPQSETIVPKKAKKSEITEYKPFQVPPDFKLAKKHGLAKKIGKISSYSKYLETGQCCICCNLPFHKSKFKLQESIDKFASLGSAFTLFFTCNKQMIALLTSYFLIGGLRNLFEVYEACWNQECSSFLGIIYSENSSSMSNTCSKDFYLRNAINFAAFWVLFVGVIVSKIQQDSKNIVLQKNIASHCDFTILVKGVEDTNCEEELKQFLSTRLITGLKLEITKVNRAYKIQEYFELASQKIKLINQLENLKDKQAEIRRQEKLKQERNRFFENVPLIGGKNEKKYQENKKKLKDQLDQNSKALNILEEKYADNDGSDIRTELVFVTFEKQQDCISVKKKYFGQRFRSTLLFRNKILTFLPAYEPLDVVWENLEVSNTTKIYRRILFLLLAIMMTVGSLMAVSLVTKWQKDILDQRISETQQDINVEMRNYILSCLCIVIIAAINSLLTITLTTFSQFEKHNTFTSSIISISEKLSWIQFVNTALVPFVILLILTPEDQQNQETKNEYLQYVLQDIFFIFIGNVVFAPIVVLLNPEFYIKKIQRWWYQRQGPLCTKTQQQLNEIYEDPEFLIQEYYAIINRIILCSFFYATMLSLGILLNCIAMTGLYWAFKYTFIRRSAYPKCLSSNLHEHMQGIMLFTPLIYTIGNLTYGKVFLGCSNSDLFSAFNIIEIIFGFALLAFRGIFVGVLARFYHKSAYSKSYQNTYSFEKRFMGLSYGQANPITRAFDASGISRMGLVTPETFQISLIESNLQKNIEKSEKQSNIERQVDGDPIRNPVFRQTITAAIEAKQLKNEKNYGQKQTQQQLSEEITKSKRIKDVSYGKQLSNINFEEVSDKPPTRKAIRKNTQTSIMQYAFTNVLLSRERHNLIISAAFERKEQGKQNGQSEENQDEQEEDNVEQDEESNFSFSDQSPSGKQDYEMEDLTKQLKKV